MPRSRLALALASTALAATLVGCSDVGAPMPTPTPSPTYAVTGDGVLRIGTLFASGSPDAAAQVAGVEAAVREINEAGGVNGQPVEVFHRNSGDPSADTAETAYADLIAKGVDVVITPSSPELAAGLADAVASAGVPLVSATPAFSAQGAVLAAAMAAEGVESVAYLALDGADGDALLESLVVAAAGHDMTIDYSASFAETATTVASLVSKAKKAKPDAVVIATPPAAAPQAAALITALDTAGLGGSALWLTSGNSTDYSAVLSPGVLDGAHGIVGGAAVDDAFAARVRQADPRVTTTRFAAEAHDATILAALAAVRAGDDGGPAIARLLPVVSAQGIRCTSYGACLDVLSTEPDVDFDGVSGPVDLGADGQVTVASWGVYVFGPENSPTLDHSVIG